MVATAKPTEELLAGRRALDSIAAVRVLEDWRPGRIVRGKRPWLLRLALTPPDLGTRYPIPTTTEWCVLVDEDYPHGQISFYPAVENGLAGFYPHQARGFPDVTDGAPWREGKICVATNSENNLANTAEVEPADAHTRLAFQTQRALEWIHRASRGTLLGPGDPFELPVFTMDLDRPLVSFWEGPETFRAWFEVEQRYGLVDLVRMGQRGPGCLVARRFESPTGRALVSPQWGSYIDRGRTAGKAVWVRLTSLPVLPPWAAPVTWGELRAAAKAQAIGLDAYLRPALNLARERRARYLLIGFPVEETMGGERKRYHWQPAVLGFRTTTRRRRRGTTRRHKASPWIFDYILPMEDETPIRWAWGANWHPDQIGSRGRFPESLTEKRVLLLGAGALGSTVAEMLARGGVRDLTIVDPDLVEAGNLVRHTLDLDYVRAGKAEALADHLIRANPNVTARGYRERFPNIGAESRGYVDAADIVIDTTADEDLLAELGSYEWPGPRRFTVLSVTYAAGRLLAFVADGSEFPVEAFREQVGPWMAEQREAALDLPHEGVGCWHPVFPARADDIYLLAATATEALAKWPSSTKPTLRVFERSEDGDSMPVLNQVADHGG